MECLLHFEPLYSTLVLETKGQRWAQVGARCEDRWGLLTSGARLPPAHQTRSSLTCSAEMSSTSWRAFSMPSLVPVILIWLLASSGRGIWILVAVFSSKSCSFSPFLPITKRWCSLGMATVAEAYNRHSTKENKSICRF